MDKQIIYVLSDSVGETAELVVKAAVSQFNHVSDLELQRVPYVENKETLDETLMQASENQAVIVFTLVNPDFRKYLLTETEKRKIACIDLLGPVMDAMENVFDREPRLEPGLVHKLDEDYFRRVEAIEFAVRYDDGRDPRGIATADIILIGVSRTSKTPLSQYLAHKKIKVANVPIVPEVEPPPELFKIDPKRCIGLKISPNKLNDIRKERLKALGLGEQASYAKMDRIQKELRHFEAIVDKIGCQVIDVSNKAVEETANQIMHIKNYGFFY